MINGKKSKSVMDTRVLVKAAFLTAISIVLTRFVYTFLPIAGGVPAIRLSVGEVPLILTGMMFGPVVGGIAGLAADLIGVLINPQGVFHPGFTLSSISWGLIPGLLFLIFKRRDTYEKKYSKANIVIAVTICFIIISLGLNTLWLSQMFGKGFIVLFIPRVITVIPNIIIQSVILITLVKYLKGVINA